MESPRDSNELTAEQRSHLRRCVELARTALEAGDEPFGSILVDGQGTIRHEERNRVNSLDATRHPEFEIARWASTNLTEDERRESVVYTSGEHCPMCSTAHALAGLGPIRYATSFQQLRDWRREWGFTSSPTVDLPIAAVAPHIDAVGPYPSSPRRSGTSTLACWVSSGDGYLKPTRSSFCCQASLTTVSPKVTVPPEPFGSIESVATSAVSSRA